MPFGFGPTYGTGTADYIKSTVQMPLWGLSTSFLIAVRGYLLSSGGGTAGRAADIINVENASLFTVFSNATNQWAANRSAGTSTVTTAFSVPGFVAAVGSYLPPNNQTRAAVNTATPVLLAGQTATFYGMSYVVLGNSIPVSLARHWDGLLYEVAVYLGHGVGAAGAFVERQWIAGASPYDLVSADATLVFYTDGQSRVNLVDGNPLEFSGAKVVSETALPSALKTYGPIRATSFRGQSNPACGWPQMARVLTGVQ